MEPGQYGRSISTVWQLGCLDREIRDQRPDAFRPILADSLAFSEALQLCNVILRMSRKFDKKLTGEQRFASTYSERVLFGETPDGYSAFVRLILALGSILGGYL